MYSKTLLSITICKYMKITYVGSVDGSQLPAAGYGTYLVWIRWDYCNCIWFSLFLIIINPDVFKQAFFHVKCYNFPLQIQSSWHINMETLWIPESWLWPPPPPAESGGVYRVMNAHTIGQTEVQIMQLLVDGVKLLIEMEKALKDPEGGIEHLVPTQK